MFSWLKPFYYQKQLESYSETHTYAECGNRISNLCNTEFNYIVLKQRRYLPRLFKYNDFTLSVHQFELSLIRPSVRPSEHGFNLNLSAEISPAAIS